MITSFDQKPFINQHLYQNDYSQQKRKMFQLNNNPTITSIPTNLDELLQSQKFHFTNRTIQDKKNQTISIQKPVQSNQQQNFSSGLQQQQRQEEKFIPNQQIRQPVSSQYNRKQRQNYQIQQSKQFTQVKGLSCQKPPFNGASRTQKLQYKSQEPKEQGQPNYHLSPPPQSSNKQQFSTQLQNTFNQINSNYKKIQFQQSEISQGCQGQDNGMINTKKQNSEQQYQASSLYQPNMQANYYQKTNQEKNQQKGSNQTSANLKNFQNYKTQHDQQIQLQQVQNPQNINHQIEENDKKVLNQNHGSHIDFRSIKKDYFDIDQNKIGKTIKKEIQKSIINKVSNPSQQAIDSQHLLIEQHTVQQVNVKGQEVDVKDEVAQKFFNMESTIKKIDITDQQTNQDYKMEKINKYDDKKKQPMRYFYKNQSTVKKDNINEQALKKDYNKEQADKEVDNVEKTIQGVYKNQQTLKKDNNKEQSNKQNDQKEQPNKKVDKKEYPTQQVDANEQKILKDDNIEQSNKQNDQKEQPNKQDNTKETAVKLEDIKQPLNMQENKKEQASLQDPKKQQVNNQDDKNEQENEQDKKKIEDNIDFIPPNPEPKSSQLKTVPPQEDYPIALFLGCPGVGKTSIMKKLFNDINNEIKEFKLYGLEIDEDLKYNFVDTKGFDFESDINERESQIKCYQSIFYNYPNKVNCIFVVVNFERTDLMKKKLLLIYKFFRKFQSIISIIVTDMQLSNDSNLAQTDLNKQFSNFKPLNIIFLRRDTSKQQLIHLLKQKSLNPIQSNYQFDPQDTIFEQEDEQEMQKLQQQLIKKFQS